MTRLEDLPNLGPKLAAALREAGIETPEALRDVGAVEAWQRIHPQFDCLPSLTSLQGAVRGVPKAMLDADARDHLRRVWREDSAAGSDS